MSGKRKATKRSPEVSDSNGVGPNAFRVRMSPTRMLICDPDVPIKHGCLVVVELDAGRYLPGTLRTLRPDRAKTLEVMAEDGVRLRRVRRERVFCVTWEHLRPSWRPFKPEQLAPSTARAAQ